MYNRVIVSYLIVSCILFFNVVSNKISGTIKITYIKGINLIPVYYATLISSPDKLILAIVNPLPSDACNTGKCANLIGLKRLRDVQYFPVLHVVKVKW